MLFPVLSYALKRNQNFFYCSIQNIKSNCWIFFTIFFQSIFSDGKSFPSQLYLFIQGLIVCYSFSIFSYFLWLNPTAIVFWKYLWYFLLIGFIIAFSFLFNQKNLYMIHQDTDLFFDVCNAINELNWRQTNLQLFWFVFWVV